MVYVIKMDPDAANFYFAFLFPARFKILAANFERVFVNDILSAT